MNMLQICVFGIAGVLLAIQLKQQKAEISICICICISLAIFTSVFQYLDEAVATIHKLTSAIQLNKTYVSTLLKMLGITYLSEFASNICKDAGYQTIAIQIEIFGKLTILVLSLPILVALLQTIQNFLG